MNQFQINRKLRDQVNEGRNIARYWYTALRNKGQTDIVLQLLSIPTGHATPSHILECKTRAPRSRDDIVLQLQEPPLSAK